MIEILLINTVTENFSVGGGVGGVGAVMLMEENREKWKSHTLKRRESTARTPSICSEQSTPLSKMRFHIILRIAPCPVNGGKQYRQKKKGQDSLTFPCFLFVGTSISFFN